MNNIFFDTDMELVEQQQQRQQQHGSDGAAASLAATAARQHPYTSSSGRVRSCAASALNRLLLAGPRF
jgi:hypothetical protein